MYEYVGNQTYLIIDFSYLAYHIKRSLTQQQSIDMTSMSGSHKLITLI